MNHQGKLALVAATALGFVASTTNAVPILPLPGSGTEAVGELFEIQTSDPVAINDDFSMVILQVVGSAEFKPNAFAGAIVGEFVQQQPIFGPAVFPTPTLNPLFPGDIPEGRVLDSLFLIQPPPLVIVSEPSEPVVDPAADLGIDALHRVGVGSELRGEFALDLREDALTVVWDLAKIVYPNDAASLPGGDTALAVPVLNFDATVGGGGREESFNFSFEAPPIPEPATAGMVGMLGAFGLMRRKR